MRQRRPRGQAGAGVGSGGGEDQLDRAGCDWGEEGPSGRSAGGGGQGRRPAARRSGTQGHLGVGGHLPAPGEGPVPRQGSSPKAVLWDNSGSPKEPQGRGGVEVRALRGAAGRNLRATGLPPGRGSGHVSRGASEQRVWGRAPGIVGDRARGGSRGEPDSGWVGVGGRGLDTQQGRERKGRLLRAGGGPRVGGRLRKGRVEG